MTRNQIEYQKSLESHRANVASETQKKNELEEVKRHNQESEKQNQMSINNQNQHYVRMDDAELQKLAETIAHNKVSELQGEARIKMENAANMAKLKNNIIQAIIRAGGTWGAAYGIAQLGLDQLFGTYSFDPFANLGQTVITDGRDVTPGRFYPSGGGGGGSVGNGTVSSGSTSLGTSLRDSQTSASSTTSGKPQYSTVAGTNNRPTTTTASSRDVLAKLTDSKTLATTDKALQNAGSALGGAVQPKVIEVSQKDGRPTIRGEERAGVKITEVTTKKRDDGRYVATGVKGTKQSTLTSSLSKVGSAIKNFFSK